MTEKDLRWNKILKGYDTHSKRKHQIYKNNLMTKVINISLCLVCIGWFGAIPGRAQSLHLALCSDFIPDGAGWQGLNQGQMHATQAPYAWIPQPLNRSSLILKLKL